MELIELAQISKLSMSRKRKRKLVDNARNAGPGLSDAALQTNPIPKPDVQSQPGSGSESKPRRQIPKVVLYWTDRNRQINRDNLYDLGSGDERVRTFPKSRPAGAIAAAPAAADAASGAPGGTTVAVTRNGKLKAGIKAGGIGLGVGGSVYAFNRHRSRRNRQEEMF